jgi:RNA polymerase sigma-70 factor, ECF subfamily
VDRTVTADDEELDRLGRAAARGDGAAFDALCRGLSGDVWRYCLALAGEAELAREAAQDTFLRLVTAVRRYRGEAPVRVYTLVLARRAVAAALQRERRHRERSSAPVDRAAPDQLGAVELDRLVGALPDPLRQAFVLTQLVGLSYEEAAAVSGCALGTIRSRVFRARARLVDALDKEASDARS